MNINWFLKLAVAAAVLVLGIFPACTPPLKPVVPAFYYWKTTFSLSNLEREYLHQIHSGQLFLKFADIGRNPVTREIEPFSLLQVTDTLNAQTLHFVPCFFITNNVFEAGSQATPAWLAERLLETVASVGGQFGKKTTDWTEIQIDCDWTSSTRTAYFLFLQQLKKKLSPQTILTATIRLHQYKNPRQTGVPPVDRGVLMCYNTGDIDSETATNSIFSLPDAVPYFQNAVSYPLPLDLALPVFSWALVYRDAALWRIIPETDAGSWSDTTLFAPSGTMIQVKKATFKGGQYLSAGDRIRLEISSPGMLRPAIPLLAGVQLAADARLLFYHLDSAAISRFDPTFIQELCDTINQSRGL